MAAISVIARCHRLFLLEDGAQAHGGECNGRRVGSIGDLAAFSFYGNKIISTSEGEMVVTDDEEMAGRMRQLKSEGADPVRRYWFPVVGYNYRVTNVTAAIGLGRLEKVDWPATAARSCVVVSGGSRQRGRHRLAAEKP